MNISGEKTEWNGFDRYDFKLEGHECIIVVPHQTAQGCPWIWRARFFGAFPNLDLAMLERGWHIAYIDVANLYGSPEAMRRFDLFYDYLTGSLGFAAKPVLEGYSRGGLPVYNWAALNTDKVTCIYADAPVCDFKSWPGGKGEGPGSPEDWERCLAAYGMTEQEAMEYPLNPVDNLRPLAEAGMPIIHVCGDADEVVPVAENTAVVERRYRELGGHIEVIHKPECLHHPHCLENPVPIVEFIEKQYNV